MSEMSDIERIRKLLEYLYSLEKVAQAEGYDLASLGYSDEIQETIDLLDARER